MSAFANPPADADADRPWEQPGAIRRDWEPDRGRLLRWLVLGSAVCVCLVVLSPVGLAGWIAVCCMARQDLLRMRQGWMDPRERKVTEAAYCDSAACLILSASLILGLVVALLCGAF